jgi:hypothetical protein
MPIVIQRGDGTTLRARGGADALTTLELAELWDLLVLKYFCRHLVLQYVHQVKIEWREETNAYVAVQLRTEASTWYKDRSADHGCDLLDEAFSGAWEWYLEATCMGSGQLAGDRTKFADKVAKDIVSLVNEAATALESGG